MAKEPCYMKAAIRLASSSMVTNRKVGWRIRKGASGKRVAPFVYPGLPERLKKMNESNVSAPTPEPKKKMKLWKKVAIGFGAVMLIGIIGSAMDGNQSATTTQNPPASSTPAIVSTAQDTQPSNNMEVGQEGFLRLPGNNDASQVICLGETKDDYNKINKALAAKDFLGILEIPGAFCVHNGSKVLLIDKDFPACRVRVVQGVAEVDKDKVGMSGYVPYEWVMAK